MLPDCLSSSLRACKDDTDTVATWLAGEAAECGYPQQLICGPQPPSTQRSTRLKGKTRKGKKINAKVLGLSTTPQLPRTEACHTVQASHFTTLAKHIAASRSHLVKVPKAVVDALGRAIELRKRHNVCSKEHEENGGPLSQSKADEGRPCFMRILELTREILKPLMPSDAVDDHLSEPSAAASAKEDPTQRDNQLGNMFGQLNLHKSPEDFIGGTNVTSIIISKPNHEQKYHAEIIHGLEEQHVAACCLFKDIGKMRSLLSQLWKRYEKGDIDLVAVSLTTDIAIEFVQSLEMDYLRQFPELSGHGKLVNLFYETECRIRKQDPGHKEKPEDPFNFAVYDLAEECLLPTLIISSSVTGKGPSPLDKPGCYGIRNLKDPRSAKTPRAKFEYDRIVIREIFGELKITARLLIEYPLPDDELIRGIRGMSFGDPIPLWFVFALQCFLDSQHVLKQNVGRGHEELMTTAATIKDSMNYTLDSLKSLRIDNWPQTLDAHFTNTVKLIEVWVERDIVAEACKKVIKHPLRTVPSARHNHLGLIVGIESR